MEPLSLIVALAVGVLAKKGIDQLLKKSPKVTSLNERLKYAYRKHEDEIRSALGKAFPKTAVDLVCGLVKKQHLSEADVAHLKEQDPKLYREFVRIAASYDPEIVNLTEDVRKVLT